MLHFPPILCLVKKILSDFSRKTGYTCFIKELQYSYIYLQNKNKVQSNIIRGVGYSWMVLFALIFLSNRYLNNIIEVKTVCVYRPNYPATKDPILLFKTTFPDRFPRAAHLSKFESGGRHLILWTKSK